MSGQNKNDHLSRFQELLQEIFQFDFADLDTGICRLFRLREKELRRFIEETLPDDPSSSVRVLSTGGEEREHGTRCAALRDR